MNPSPPIGTRTSEPKQSGVLPSWVGSMLFHAVLVVLLALLVRPVISGAVAEPDRTTGIVLKKMDEEQTEYYEGEENVAAEQMDAKFSDAVADPLPVESDLPFNPIDALPKPDSVGPGAVLGGRPGELGNPNLTGIGQANRNMKGGAARVTFFGAVGTGTKFSYIMDRSASMGSPANRPLNAAKREVIRSLESIQRLHQFQIIFYNHNVRVYNPTGVRGKLIFGTEQNKTLAKKFIASIQADGSTDHFPALLTAIDARPDVIFFLTDGLDTVIDSAQMRTIARRNSGRSSIHVIEFGAGEASLPDNFLTELARQNGGNYVYVNVRKF